MTLLSFPRVSEAREIVACSGHEIPLNAHVAESFTMRGPQTCLLGAA
jgi:hypothetical protein